MITQFNILKSWLVAQTKSERGASLVEYALLVALIAVACIAAMSFIASGANETLSGAGTELTNATP